MSQVTFDVSVPYLLLDVDGVIAPSGGEPYYDTPAVWAQLPPGRMHFKADVLDRLTLWHEQGLVRVVWLTSWQDVAVTHLGPAFGLPQWPYHARRDAPPAYIHTDFWKERFVLAYLDAGARVVWCDDDIAFRAEATGDGDYEGRLLSVSPSSGIGLTVEDMDGIEKWVIGSVDR